MAYLIVLAIANVVCLFVLAVGLYQSVVCIEVIDDFAVALLYQFLIQFSFLLVATQQFVDDSFEDDVEVLDEQELFEVGSGSNALRVVEEGIA